MSLESENEELKTRLFQVEHMNGMLDAQIQKLNEDVRVLTLRNESLQAQIQELQAAPEPNAQERWQGYKTMPGVYPFVEGAFDQMEVSRWEATQKSASAPKNTTVYFRGSPHTAVLPGNDLYQAFTRIFGEYLRKHS